MSELLQRFQYSKILAQDSKAKTITLLGTIDGKHAIVLAEKSAFNVNKLDSITKPAGIAEDMINNIYVCSLPSM